MESSAHFRWHLRSPNLSHTKSLKLTVEKASLGRKRTGELAQLRIVEVNGVRPWGQHRVDVR